MRYNMDFLVAALIFLIVLWHHFMKQRQFAGNKTEKTFQIFMMLGIGDIVLDIHEEEKKGLTVEGLLEKFKTGAGKMLDNDRILLSGEK